MKNQTPIEFLMKGVGLSVESDGTSLFIGGDTFRVKGMLQDLGFAFRRGEQAWMPSFWMAKDSEAARVAVQAKFPAASGWGWIAPVAA